MSYTLRKAIGVPFPLSPSYCVTNNGNVYRSGKALRPVLNGPDGYLQISLWENGKGRTWFVHHIVAITFHGPRPGKGYHAAHRDGNKTNNNPSNVQWLTKEENEADKIRHGRSNRGQRNGMSRTARMLRGQL